MCRWRKKRGQQGFGAVFAQSGDFSIVGFAFFAVVVAEIFVVAVTVALAVGFVVFFVVAHQIMQGEAVVCGEKVDAV